MAQFRYKAFDSKGILHSGEITAQNVSLALEQLHSGGIVPYEIGPDVKVTRTHWLSREIRLGRELSIAALTRFTRELATLIEADIPVDEALNGIIRSNGARGVDRFARRLLDRIRAGAALSEALKEEQKLIPDYYISLVSAGESSGRLGDNLQQLAVLLERLGDVRGKVVSALIYPAILFAMALVTVSILVTVLIPELAPIFESAGTDPPALFAIVIGAQTFFARNWPLIGGMAFLAVGLSGVILRRELARRWLDKAWLMAPIAGELTTKLEAARYSRTLGAMLSNGVTMLSALEISARLLKSLSFRGAAAEIIKQTREGGSFSDEIAKSGLFPDVAVRLIGVGERSGRLPEMLLHTAKILEGETERQIYRLMSVLTPVLTLSLGLFVGLLVVSVMNAILSINQLAL